MALLGGAAKHRSIRNPAGGARKPQRLGMLMPMDGINTVYESLVERRPGEAPASRTRSFLFLQGPISDFSERLGRALLARGHRVHRVNLHLGDQLFWRLPATHFRGRFDEWRGF